MPTVPTRCLPPGELERRRGELERRPMSLLMTEIAVAVSRLAEAGVESPRADAELMAAPPPGVPPSAPHPVARPRLHPPVLGGRPRRAGRRAEPHNTRPPHLPDARP